MEENNKLNAALQAAMEENAHINEKLLLSELSQEKMKEKLAFPFPSSPPHHLTSSPPNLLTSSPPHHLNSSPPHHPPVAPVAPVATTPSLPG